jgi:predicted O-linked N-acetylglucosamine transferase (SPINDLY family)
MLKNNDKNKRDHDRIRVAYMSGDFREHPVAYLTSELFELHDRNKFDIHAISIGPKIESATRTRLEKAFDHWHEAGTLSDRDVAELIRNLGINIIVDLMGYTGDSRPKVLMCRPAPIQVNYLGYPGTMAGNFIDYIVIDRFVAPTGHDKFYTEKLARLPHSYMVHDSKREVAAGFKPRTDYGLPEDGFVFCCFNNTYKITPGIFNVWMRLLKKVQGSVLWLSERNNLAQDNLRREAEMRGVTGDRVIFAPRLPDISHHLARHRQANLFLDTPIYNAHTTAIDALWTGLPVLTCAGSSFASRVAGSLLHAVGLPELVTNNLVDYEALALKLAHEPALLASYTERLVRNGKTAPLFDCQRFTIGMEAAYTQMYERWCAGDAPEAFSVFEDD